MTIQPISAYQSAKSRNQIEASATVEIYRPFFLAGILTVLTAGCTLGAIALVGLSLQGSYVASAWTPYVLAHANSQLYGWVGFFIMGFALQTHPPRASKANLFHVLAVLSLTFMALGIGLRFVADPMAAARQGAWVQLGIGSALLQLSAVILFLVNLTLTRVRTGEPLGWQTKFVFASLFWMFLVAVAEPFAFALSHQAPQQSIMFVAEYYSPLREAQFLGFVANMIFGISLVKLGSCFGFQPAHRGLGNAAFFAWNSGILLRMYGWIAYFRSGMTESANHPYLFSGTILACAATFFVLSSRVYEKSEGSVPSQKFIRASLGWLLAGGALMILEPVHLRQIGMPFSHAYIGGIRHALTVGFISQMIIGVGTHVASRMNDIPDKVQSNLWATFWLLNIGNAGRVCLELATDYTPKAFTFMGATGFIELTGLVIWAYVMVRTMVNAKSPVSAT